MPSNLKKIRDIERMMKKFGETPELQAKLAQAKSGKEKVQLNEKMRKNSTKYHMVKFLERKKVTRLVRSMEAKLKVEMEPAAQARMAKSRDKLLDDLAYIMYYPIEHKYIALFPSKEALQIEEESEEEPDLEKSKLLSKKAREVALQRWADDKRQIAEGQTAVLDKVAYAMEVEYKGGAAALESMPAKAASAKAAAIEREPKKPKAAGKAGKEPAPAPATAAAASKSAAGSKVKVTDEVDADSSGSSSSASSDSSSDSSDCGSDSDSDAPPAKKAKPAEAIKLTSSSAAGASKPTKKAVEVEEPKSEDSEDDKDDFFVEEASESELANNNSTVQPKVYNDGNAHRYKGERQSVHEIRFAATKRKYENHKRVFNNQNKRSAQERRK